ncbi:MAG: metallophosphoesterase [Polyangiales bacterium]
MAKTFSWLHLTDLHFGHNDQRYLWDAVEESFLEDLTRLHAKSGPWDAVLFTGDLTQQGTREEFAKLRAMLDELWSHETFSNRPALITVPGNHDLVRPDASRPEVEALRRWHDDEAMRTRFWSDDASPERAVITTAFAEYTAFREAWKLPEGFSVTRGRVPGDVSVSFECNGLRVGIVGLNTAALHLWGGDLTGTLTVEREQLFAVCDRPSKWTAAHDVALLLTHHPPDWLHKRAAEIFGADILARDRFLAHLYGHMHEAGFTREGSGGSPERRRVQGPSLFGMEHLGGGSVQRIHGCMAGRVTIDGERGEFRVWPRRLITVKGGSMKLVPAEELDLSDEAVVTTFTPKRRAGATKETERGPIKINDPPAPRPSRKYQLARALHGMSDAQITAALDGLAVPDEARRASDAMLRAKAVVDHLEARGQLDELARRLGVEGAT